MPTSCRTHDYDGKLREQWFRMRPMLLEKYLPDCPSFDETVNQIEGWIETKYGNVPRIGRARRAIRILRTQRRSNFDSRNDIDVEELLPILWNQVKDKNDLHGIFYEQVCDITGGSCSQGRSTRLFQFLFLFDLPITQEQPTEGTDLPPTTTTNVTSPSNTEQERQNQSIVTVEDDVSVSVEATPDDVQKQESGIEQTDEGSQMSTQENSHLGENNEQDPSPQVESISSPSSQ